VADVGARLNIPVSSSFSSPEKKKKPKVQNGMEMKSAPFCYSPLHPSIRPAISELEGEERPYRHSTAQTRHNSKAQKRRVVVFGS
jgi:hypothetical protein